MLDATFEWTTWLMNFMFPINLVLPFLPWLLTALWLHWSKIQSKRRAEVLREKLKKEIEEEKKRRKEEDEEYEQFRSVYKPKSYHYDKPNNMLYYVAEGADDTHAMFSANLANDQTTWLFEVTGKYSDPGVPLIALDESILFVVADRYNCFYYDIKTKKVEKGPSLSLDRVGGIVAVGNRLIVREGSELTLFEMDGRRLMKVQEYRAEATCHLHGSTFVHSDGDSLCVSTLQNGRLHRQSYFISANKGTRITRRSKNVFELARRKESHLYLVEMVNGYAKLDFLRSEKPSNDPPLPLESAEVEVQGHSKFKIVVLFILLSVLHSYLFLNNVGFSSSESSLSVAIE